ncbi:MAG: TonB family protein [Acidobacteriia bacterium]|nr:TonB family protein [Terriglobia bacterium]
MKPPLWVLIAPALLLAQTPDDPVQRIGPGITPPGVISKKEPTFSPQARANHAEGTVVVEIVIDENGRATNMRVISPLGFGLDEEAEKAVSKWQFRPAMKDGHPVKVYATGEVNFRYTGSGFDEKAERRRTRYNEAIMTIGRADAATPAIDSALKTIQSLAKETYPPAMHLYGVWEARGEHVPQNPPHALELFQEAAARNYGPALYEIALRRIQGRDLSADPDRGLEEMRQGAMLGSVQAQGYLGDRYEKGDGVERDLDRSRRYFRLCAARDIAVCQYRLGRSLIDEAGRSERDYIQGVAWLQLAEAHGLQQAKDGAEKEIAKLTASQARSVNSMRTQLVRK